MTVALERGLQEAEPLLNENLWYDSISGYISESIGLLSERNPSPGWPTAKELAGPLVASLAVEESDLEQHETRATVIDALHGAYMPLSENPASGGEINPCQASRNFVTTVMLEAQRWAFETNDQALSAAVVRLACTLLERETAGDMMQPPRLLSVIVQAAVAKQAEATARASDSRQTEAASWFAPEDKGLIHDALGRALCAEALHLDKPTINFLLEGYGLKSDVLLNAWNIGFHDSYPYGAPNDVVKENLQRIVAIEQISPGISHRLHDSARKLRCFARLSSEFLLYLDKKRPSNKPQGIFFVAVGDHNNALKSSRLYDRVLHAAQAQGCEIDYFEFADQEELAECQAEAAAWHPNVCSTNYRWHSDDTSADLGSPEAQWYTPADMWQNRGSIRKLHEHAASIAIYGCKSGAKGGAADMMAHIVRGGVHVYGLSHNMYADTDFSSDCGFQLWEAQQVVPLLGRLAQAYRDPKSLFKPPKHVTHSRRFGDEAEDTLYMMRRYRVTGGL